MATIKRFPFVRHARAEPSRHLMLFKRGRKRRSGRGIAFWFTPLAASLVEVPCDDREVAFHVRARSEDYQDVHVQGAITFQVDQPELLASRVDFTISVSSGRYLERPLERLEELFTQLAQKVGSEYVGTRAVRAALAVGQREIRVLLEKALAGDPALAAMGLRPVAVHIASVTPSAELEKALQAPTREAIQQRSDEAVFQRRALAVEKERAIRENELQNEIELARREEDLIAQAGTNEQRKAREEAEAAGIAARARTERERLDAETAADVTRMRTAAEAEGIESVEAARVEAESRRMDIYRDLPAHVLVGMAAQEFAGKLQRIDRIQITPEGVGPFLQDLADLGTRLAARRVEAGSATVAEVE
ncbi:MAG: SPFH domain-containing protein [Planctomycetota bacterium]